MVKIKIYGKLAKELGFNEISGECESIEDVMRYLHHTTGGDFARKLIEFNKNSMPYICHTSRIGATHFCKTSPVKEGDTIYFTPALAMSGLEAAAVGVLIKVTLINIALSIGFALLSMLLAPAPPQIADGSPEAKRKEAYLFDGRARTVNQGSCVPVGYGRMMIPGSVIYNRVDYVKI